MRKKLLLLLLLLFVSLKTYAHDIYSPYNTKKNEIIFSQNLHSIDSINPTSTTNASGSYYPGMRGANQLIIYTPEYGRKTNTNEYGSEAIVVDGTVVSLSGADSLIPANGIVISGHGTAKIWINENLMVGTKITIDKKKKIVSSYITSESFLYGAKAKVSEVCTIMNYYSQYFDGYNPQKANNYLNKAKKYIEKAEKHSFNSQKYAAMAIKNANNALATVIPYQEEELKGVWIRPESSNPKDIARILDRMAAAGINNIFLETYFHGYTIYPSKVMASYGFTPQNPNFKGDVLATWIKLAHARGIKVNIWFETFYVGNKNPKYYSQSILGVKPEWSNLPKRSYDAEGPVSSASEHNGYFLDPANPDVQKFLLELVGEIICQYKPDGINMDYLRNPQCISPKNNGHDMSNWGYTKCAREVFKGNYGVDPVDIRPNTEMWDTWSKFRQDNVTDFVIKVSELAKANNVLFTAVIFPDRCAALHTKQQDWKTWLQEGYVDGVTPLLLTCDSKTAASLMEEVLRCKPYNTKIYSGLFVTFMNGAPEDLLRQIHEARKLNTHGIIFFDYAHFDNKYVNILKAGVFKK